MGTATWFWNRIADRYSRQPVADEASYQQKLAITQRHLTPDMRVLEFGCGTGSTAIEHAPKVSRYEGVDVSERMVEIARAKAAAAGANNLTFSVGTIEALDAPDATYDAILGLNILHLVPDLDATLAAVARLLKPGGRFFSSTICVSDGSGFIGRLAPVMRALPVLPSLQSFSKAELEARIEAAGFRIEERFVPERTPFVTFLVAVRS